MINNKYFTIALVIVTVFASTLGYLAYSGAFSANSKPSPTSTPTPKASPTPSITAAPTESSTSTHSITATSTPTPTFSLTPTLSPTATPPPATLHVSIASSLTNVVANMTQAFDQANNCNLVVNSAGSNTLYTQITQGFPCDVFMSADIKWTQQLNNSNLLYNNYYTNFTTNSLEVILSQGNPKGIISLADLVKPGVKIVVADPSIPSGSYTNTTLAKIDATWGNSSSPLYINSGAYVNYNATFHQNVVSYEVTVENVVGKVSLNLGTADAGIVFVSDATYGTMTGSQVQFLPIPKAGRCCQS